MDNILANQPNCVVPKIPGRIQDWDLGGISLILLPGVPNRSYIPGAPGNSLKVDEIIPVIGLWIYAGESNLDRTSVFHPDGNNVENNIIGENGTSFTTEDGQPIIIE